MMWLPGALWEVPGTLWWLLLVLLGRPWASQGCQKGALEAAVGHSGGLLGVFGALLPALGGLIAFLGRFGSGFREIPGAILASFWITFW